MNGINSVQLMPQVNPYYQITQQPLKVMPQKPEVQVQGSVLNPYNYKKSSVPVGNLLIAMFKNKDADAYKRAEETTVKAKKLAEEGYAFKLEAEAYGNEVLKKADALKGEVTTLFNNSVNKVPESGAPVTISKDSENDMLFMTERAENGDVKRISRFNISSNSLTLGKIEEYSNGLANIYEFATNDKNGTRLEDYYEGAREGEKPNSISFEKYIDFCQRDEKNEIFCFDLQGHRYKFDNIYLDTCYKLGLTRYPDSRFNYEKDYNSDKMPDGTRVKTCGEQVRFTQINGKQNEDDASTSSVQVTKYIEDQKETVLEFDKNLTTTVETAKELRMNEKGTYGEYRENKRESRLSNGNFFDETYADSKTTSEDLKLYYNGDCWTSYPLYGNS